MNKEEKREQEKENLYKNVKQFIYSLKREKSMLNRRLNEIGKLEKEILLILSNPELAKEILGDKENESR